MIIFTCTEEEILTQNVLCHVCINLSNGSGEEFSKVSQYIFIIALLSHGGKGHSPS